MLNLLRNLWQQDPQFSEDVGEAIKQADIIGLCLSRYTRDHFEKVLELLGKMHPHNLRIESEGAAMNNLMRIDPENRSTSPSYFLCEAPMTHRKTDIHWVMQYACDRIPGICSTALVRPGISHTQQMKSGHFVANPGGHELLLETLQQNSINTLRTSSMDGIEVLSDFFRRHMQATTTSSPKAPTPEDPLGRSKN